MFRLQANPTFTHRVRVSVPVDGGHREETFKATYRVLAIGEAEEFDLSTTEGSADFLRKAIVSLDDIAGEDGQPLPYNDELREQCLRIPYVRQALAKTYFEAVAKARVGN